MENEQNCASVMELLQTISQMTLRSMRSVPSWLRRDAESVTKVKQTGMKNVLRNILATI